MTAPTLTRRYRPRGAAREVFARREAEILLSGPACYPVGRVSFRYDQGMGSKACSVPGCAKLAIALGWCAAHRRQVRLYGTPGPAKTRTGRPRGGRPKGVCSVDGCERAEYAHGMCAMHRSRFRKHGDAGPATSRYSSPGPCSHPGCNRVRKANGLCSSHNNQARQGRPTTDLRPWNDARYRDEQGRKRCSRCGSWRPVESFYADDRRRDGRVSWCARCDRDTRLLRQYGIGVDQYEALLAEQGGGCASCLRPENGVALSVDHDHACCPTRKRSCGPCVRGLLCEDCNRALGMLGDDPVVIDRLAAYVRRPRS